MRELAVWMVLVVLALPGSAAAKITKARPLQSGQTASLGAPGDAKKGVARSYADLGNGVIKDQKTGLFWEQKSDDGSIHDKDDAYTWTTGDPWEANGTAFTVFLAALNTPPCFGGFCDWRVPTIMELRTIVDYGRSNPSVPTVFDAACTPGCTSTTCGCTRTDNHWSSTSFQVSSNYAWIKSFGTGYDGTLLKSGTACVRAVRGGAN
ncbi:MAG: DUF1566 domain-containing protein [Alphaproteobacteria bacterium]